MYCFYSMECMQWDGWVHVAQIGGKDTKKPQIANYLRLNITNYAKYVHLFC